MAGEKILAGGSKKYMYIGPYYKKGHVLNGKLYDPERMSDKEIEQFMSENEFAKKWWKEVEVKSEKIIVKSE